MRPSLRCLARNFAVARGDHGRGVRRSMGRMIGGFMAEASFLTEPEATPAVQGMFDENIAEMGFVMNLSRLWAHQPSTREHLFELMSEAFAASGLSFRHRGLLVTATASTLGDSYCSLAWGYKLGSVDSGAAAASVLRGDD